MGYCDALKKGCEKLEIWRAKQAAQSLDFYRKELYYLLPKTGCGKPLCTTLCAASGDSWCGWASKPLTVSVKKADLKEMQKPWAFRQAGFK